MIFKGYVRLGILVLLGCGVGSVILRIKWLVAENEKLTAQVAQSSVQIMMQKNVLDQVAQEREQINQLLIRRARNSADNEEKLRHEIQTLQQEISGHSCVIPVTVTERLRESY
ncbi:hypothetical protein [Vibrio spartinae]|uniref:DUF2570 domain-containing protein n=1 Tax=Vibrio spartinae TaxID=1918945 RepID=A0A1N6MAV5_9VIBR|nr:hypothetical protein [Vibrio spartinae]QMV16663.1 hypothetical protein Vspart_04059 [Vibrio spartinae]SIO96487.1 hypothetical protein VSP9026_04276 [Vibrio spartinae]